MKYLNARSISEYVALLFSLTTLFFFLHIWFTT